MDDLIKMNDYCKIATHLYPLGRPITARLGALLGDIVATHKVAGFSLHSAKRFCSWCTILKAEMPAMQIGQLLNRMANLAASRRWRDADKSEHEKLVKHS